MPVIRVFIFSLDRKYRDAVILDQRSGDVVLRGKLIGSHQTDLGSSGPEGSNQVCGFRRHVKAGGQAFSGQRFFFLKPFLN
jgi:hypothetical protein